ETARAIVLERAKQLFTDIDDLHNRVPELRKDEMRKLAGVGALNFIGDQRSEVRSQRSEVRSQRSEVRSQKSEVRSQKSEVRSQKSEVRSQRSETRGQKSTIGNRQSAIGNSFTVAARCGKSNARRVKSALCSRIRKIRSQIRRFRR